MLSQCVCWLSMLRHALAHTGLCFKCGRPGHMARECTGGKVQGWEAATTACNRCGLESCECAGKGDYLR